MNRSMPQGRRRAEQEREHELGRRAGEERGPPAIARTPPGVSSMSAKPASFGARYMTRKAR